MASDGAGEDGGAGSLAMEPAPVGSREGLAGLAAATVRRKFDCDGTVWGAYVRDDGKPTCHMMDWVGCPDVRACGARVEYLSRPGVYSIVPPDSRFAPEEISEPFLFSLGGGRQYRISLRFHGNTVKQSYLTFDLRGRGDAVPFAHEVEEAEAARDASRAAAAAAAPVQAPAAPRPPTSAADAMAMGGDPVAAFMGRAVSQMEDPNLQLAFALVLRDSERARSEAAWRAEFMERQFSFMLGTIERFGAKNSGDGAIAKMLEVQRDAATRAADAAQKRADEYAARVHQQELAAAKGATEAPSPLALAFARGVEQALPAMALQAMQMVPQAAPAVVTMAQAAMAAAAPAAGAA